MLTIRDLRNHEISRRLLWNYCSSPNLSKSFTLNPLLFWGRSTVPVLFRPESLCKTNGVPRAEIVQSLQCTESIPLRSNPKRRRIADILKENQMEQVPVQFMRVNRRYLIFVTHSPVIAVRIETDGHETTRSGTDCTIHVECSLNLMV